MSNWFKSYFEISRGQLRGSIIVSVAALAIIILPEFLTVRRGDDLIQRLEFQQVVQEFADRIQTANAAIELNSADTTALKSLPGIGSVFASRIIKYRELLGGFVSISQLLEVYGLDSTRYSRIAGLVVADSAAIRKLSVNSLRFAELLRHP